MNAAAQKPQEAATVKQQATALANEELALLRRLYELREEEGEVVRRLDRLRARIAGGAEMLDLHQREVNAALAARAAETQEDSEHGNADE